MAIAIPLVAVPASAALDGGSFFVHAENVESPEFKATAGIGGTAQEGEAPGEENPGGGDEFPGLAVVANFDCVSLSLRITQDMVDFSKANEERVAAGEQALTHAEGWQSIRSMNTDGQDMAGLPEDGSTPYAVILSSQMAESFDPNSPSTLVSGTNLNGQCSLTDFRDAPAANNVYKYTNDGPNGYTESRYIEEEGKLSAITVQARSDGALGVDRQTSPQNTTPYQSNTLPQRFTLGQDGYTYLRMHFVDARDGYQRITLEERADGSGSVTFYNSDFSVADRAQAPSYIAWDTEGRFTEFQDSNQVSVMGDEVGPFTAADYNAKTGKNWDGAVPKSSDFDLTVPFRPTNPVPQDM